MMKSLPQLRSYWSNRLELLQASSVPNGRLPWMRGVQSRVYRALLALYRDGGWSEAERGPAESRLPSNDHLHPRREPELEGARPKSLARIRQTLKSVNGASRDPIQPGPSIGGLQGDDWVAVGSFHNERKSIPSLQYRLRRAGISVQLQRAGRWTILRVPWNRRADAKTILQGGWSSECGFAGRPEIQVRNRRDRIQLWFLLAGGAVASGVLAVYSPALGGLAATIICFACLEIAMQAFRR